MAYNIDFNTSSTLSDTDLYVESIKKAKNLAQAVN